MNIKISVCIPSYNRAEYLPQVLDSVLSQQPFLHEVVICEDNSPQRAHIRVVVDEYKRIYGALISYHENEINLGFDANLRELLKKATGDYVVYLGNDDILCEDALLTITGVLQRHPDIAVVLRGYGWFAGNAENIVEIIKYAPTEVFMSSGLQALSFFYRRSCVLAGLTIARQPALALETSQFDGSLFYQLHLVGNLILKHNGAFTPKLIALCRSDEKPDFGHASSEIKLHTPGEYSINTRIAMMSGIISIARSLDIERPGAFDIILKDVANYSFFWLAYHANRPFKIFRLYYKNLGALGLNKYLIFHLYYISLLIFGANKMQAFISTLRKKIGYTPKL